MMKFDIAKVIAQHQLVSDQVSPEEIRLILMALQQVIVADVVGDVVEFGCYKGTTSLFLMRLLRAIAPQRQLYIYDSFDGLPDKTAADRAGLGQEFKRGELKATKREVIENFKRAGLPLPEIKKGWFADLTPSDVPERIAFAYFDGDFYGSIKDSFAACAGRWMPGAVIVVDDYGNEHLPGARQAVDEWCNAHCNLIKSGPRLQASLAIIQLK